MGKSKHLNKIKTLFETSPIVSFKSIERIIRVKKPTKSNYAKLLISNLIKRGYIKKISKGAYTLHDDNSLAVLCFAPSYLGLQSALSAHNLWEQETIPVIITSKKIRIGIRNILGGNVLIRKTNKKFIFGIEYLQEGNFYLPFSDVEKTFIDMIIFKQKIPKEILSKFKKRIDEKKLKKYLREYSKKTKNRILKTYERKLQN